MPLNPDQFVGLDVFDVYTYLLYSPFSIAVSTILITVHLKHAELRKHPGDLILMIAFWENILSWHYLYSAIKTHYITSDIDPDHVSCTLNKYLYSFATATDTLYNIAFLLSLVFRIEYVIKGKNPIKPWMYHVAIYLLAAITVRVNKEHLGKGITGACTLNLSKRDVLFGAIFVAVYVLFAFGVYQTIKRKLGYLVGAQNVLKREFWNYYSGYIKTFVALSTMIFISYWFQYASVDYEQGEITSWRDKRLFYLNLAKMGNGFRVLLPLLLFFIRIRDPTILKYTKKLFQCCNRRNRSETKLPIEKHMKEISEKPRLLALSVGIDQIGASIKVEEDSIRNEVREGEVMINLPEERPASGTTSRETNFEAFNNEMMIEDAEDDLAWMSLMPKLMKNAYMGTFVVVTSVLYNDLINHYKKLYEGLKADARHYISWNMPSSRSSADIWTYEFDPRTDGRIRKIPDSLVPCRATFFSPSKFTEIMVAEGKFQDFAESFNIEMNREQIRKAGESGGGASGEVFLFSYDKKLILKTITKREFEVFSEFLNEYIDHMKKNPCSLIGKIYGMYKIDFHLTNRSIYLILIENVFALASGTILRKYDLKGSTFSRKVLENYTGVQRMTKINQIMKDLDFLEIEKKITFQEPELRRKLMTFLLEDVQFFKRLGILDYSLILAVVARRDWTDPLPVQSRSLRVLDTGDADHIYMVGIIDYFQEYTMSKRFEKLFKKCVACNFSLETSSQHPDKYALRFFKFFDNVFTR